MDQNIPLSMLDSDDLSRSTSIFSSDKNHELELCRAPEIKREGFISKSKFLAEYDRGFTEYIQKLYSQDVIRMIRRISYSAKLCPKFRSQPFLRLLVDSVQELMLSPFEIAVLAIYLDRFGWNDTMLSPHIALTYVGIAAKINMGAEVRHILEFLSGRIMNAEREFRKWYKTIEEFTKISIIEVNEAYTKLSEISLSGIFNYSYYVDEILQISPPYKIVSRESSENYIFNQAGYSRNFKDYNSVEHHKLNSVYDKIETLFIRNLNGYTGNEFKVPEENKKPPINKLLIAVALNQ